MADPVAAPVADTAESLLKEALPHLRGNIVGAGIADRADALFAPAAPAAAPASPKA